MAVRRNVQGLWSWIRLGLILAPALAQSQGGDKPPKPTPPQEAKPAAPQPELPARVAYLKGLDQFWKGGGGSMQGLYALAQAAAQEQLEATIEWDAALAAGKIPAKRFERQLPGFHVGTEDALYVVPDSAFFLELARQRGGGVDVRFFELLHQTFHGSVSRIYVNQLSDASACYELGSREFIALYRGWSQFKASAPKDYGVPVNQELQALEQALLSATCACGTRGVVDAGFEAFLKTFPKSPVAAQARARQQKVRANTSGITFRCGQELDLGQPLPPGVEPAAPAVEPVAPAP